MSKILVITSSFPRFIGDPSGSFLFEVFTRLKDLGHDVQVIAPHQNKLKKRELLANILVHRFTYLYPTYLQTLAYNYSIPENIKSKKFTWLQIITYTVIGTIKSLQTLKRQNSDIIVAFWAIPQGLMGAVLKKITKKPLIIGVFPVELALTRSKYKFFEPFLRKTLDIADVVIANSNFTKKSAESFGIPHHKVVVVYPGIESKEKADGNSCSIRERLSLGSSPMVLSVGRLVERKGFAYLIEAMPIVLERIPNSILIAVGDGPLMSSLKERASKLGIDKNVHFLGVVSDTTLSSLYETSDVFVLPAVIDSDGNTEGLGVVLLEAMSMAKPVVASRVGGIPEVVIDKETGFLVEQRRPDQLAKAITTLLLDKELSASFGSKGRNKVKEAFSWNEIAKQFSAIVEKTVYMRQNSDEKKS